MANLYKPSLFRPVEFPECEAPVQCEPMPVCPSCGGLHTLCRPRFFAGQLLTEEDLNRLDRYIAEKNRLHNRYIHGWGVACGLEVICSVCDAPADRGKVVVKPGYALSPCGNDIVVAETRTVDVCEIIQRCRPPEDECFSPTREIECEDAEEEWILAVCYQEKTAREVVALRAAGQCVEGKQAAGQCGCGGAADKAPTAHGVNVARAPQCEPTVVCETHAFRAYKVPKLTQRKQRQMGALVRRFVCCMLPFMEDLGGLPAKNYTAAQLQQWLMNLKEALREFLRREGLYDCEVAQEIAAVVIPDPSDPEYLKLWTDSTVNVLAVALLVMQKCLCAALLPPCPEPAMDDCVPIATVTLGRNPCRVVKVCNVSSRRFLLTWPNVHYWLSWTPLFGPATGAQPPRTLRDVLVYLCCTTLGDHFRPKAWSSLGAMYKTDVAGKVKKTAKAKAASFTGIDAGAQAAGHGMFASLLAGALIEEGAGADLGTLLLAAMGAEDAEGNPLVSELGLSNPGEFVLMSQLAAPLMKEMLPLSMMAAAPGAGQGAASAEEIAGLRREVAELSKLVKAQAGAITQLKKARK